MRTQRNFYARPAQEQLWLLKESWCDKCKQADLGVVEPEEYEEESEIFVAGKCAECGNSVVTQIAIRSVG